MEKNLLSKKELIAQKRSTEPNRTTIKLAWEGPREFVEYNYVQILQQNIKMFSSKQGPSCTCLDQLPSLHLIIIRFTTPASVKNSDSISESWTPPAPMKKAKSFENKTSEKSSQMSMWWNLENLSEIRKEVQQKLLPKFVICEIMNG